MLPAVAAEPRRIGVLLVTSECPPPPELVDALAKLGWVRGQSAEFDCASGVGRLQEMPLIANALVARKPDVIVSALLPGVRALRDATRTIPIVAMGVADPVGQGLIHSLVRPGGNLTGLVSVMLEVEEKRIELLKLALPRATRLAAVYREGEPGYYAAIDGMLQRSGRAHGLTHQRFYYRTGTDISGLLDQIGAGRFDAVYFPPSPITETAPQLVSEEALKRRLAVIGQGVKLAEAGALMSYAPDRAHVAQRTAAYVDKILRGTKASELPFEQPTKFEFVINLKTAKTLGLSIPQPILLRADRVIE